MKQYLLTPAGFYLGRILRGISKIKPNKIIVITDRNEKWKELEDETVAELKAKLTFPWVQTGSFVVEEWESLSDYEICLSNLLKTIDKITRKDPEALIFIDITSATRFFTIAAVNVSTLYKNVVLQYTPRSKKKTFKDLNPEDRTDMGQTPMSLQLPYVPALDKFEEDPYLKSIILALDQMGGKSFSMKELLLVVRGFKTDSHKYTKRDLIGLSRRINILETYGFVEALRVGRRKSVKLTGIGRAFARAFLNSRRELSIDRLVETPFRGARIPYALYDIHLIGMTGDARIELLVQIKNISNEGGIEAQTAFLAGNKPYEWENITMTWFEKTNSKRRALPPPEHMKSLDDGRRHQYRINFGRKLAIGETISLYGRCFWKNFMNVTEDFMELTVAAPTDRLKIGVWLPEEASHMSADAHLEVLNIDGKILLRVPIEGTKIDERLVLKVEVDTLEPLYTYRLSWKLSE